jgi:hypothetical protein
MKDNENDDEIILNKYLFSGPDEEKTAYSTTLCKTF